MAYQTEELIQVTSMAAILAELVFRNEITDIIDVRDENLAETADLFDINIDREESEVVTEILEKYSSGKIGIISYPYQSLIPAANAVECIRLEPYYLVKDLNKKY